MGEWETYKLGDLVNLYSGGTPNKANALFWDGDIPWISAKSMYEDYLETSDTFITELGLKNGTRLAKKGTILLLTRGSGLFNRIPVCWALRDLAYNQDVKNIVSKNESLVSTEYLYYWLYGNKDAISSILETTGIGAGKIDTERFLNLEVSLPSLNKQGHILRTIKPLFDKITLNNRINHNLEEQAQALYKSWFVDFEPFKDGKFIDSELGMIPDGWHVKNLLELSQLFDSKRKPLSGKDRDQMAKLYPYYGATSIMDFVDSYIFDGTYLLMGEDGSVMTEDGYPFLQYVTGKFWPNNHAHVLQGNNGFSTEMLHCALLRKVIKSSVTGAVQAKISQANMRKILFPCPSSAVLKAFDSQLQTLYCQKRCIEAQNANLTSLRDSMLPQLMSGQLNC